MNAIDGTNHISGIGSLSDKMMTDEKLEISTTSHSVKTSHI